MSTKTFREVIVRSYTDVNEKDGIDLEQFLEATDGMINMFGKKKTWFVSTF